MAYVWKKQYDRAIAEAERAIALDPNDAGGYDVLGQIQRFVGQPEESIRLTEKAMRLNPRYPVGYLVDIGIAYRVARRYEEAIVSLKKALILSPDLWVVHANLAACYAELGRLEEARAAVAELRRLNPKFSLEVFKHFLPYKDPAEIEHFLDGMRKAGLK